ncbi:hypothetical protein [Haloarcula rubripromontorii]|uniref:hypothetical protein n=1 Tax=Haloarcula rubripromontorii TaxID=1705562 RepID=UPI00345B5DCE
MSDSIDELRALLEEQQERIESLEEEQAMLQQKYQAAKEQNDQVLNLFEQFKSGSISRRAFLTSVSAVAGISWFAGNADAAPNWSNALGNSGTQSKPLKNVYAQNATLQSLSTAQSTIGSSWVGGGSLTLGDDSSTKLQTSIDGYDEDSAGLLTVSPSTAAEDVAVVAESYDGLSDLSSNNVTVLTGNGTRLDGTTGTDGEITVARYFRETRIENRSGSEVLIKVSVLNGAD